VYFETVRLMLGLAALEKEHIIGLDAWNVYLYRKIDKKIYIEQSESFKKRS